MHGNISTLALAEDGLYVGGHFDTAGTTVASNIAKFGTEGWNALESGIEDCKNTSNPSIHSMTVVGSDMYVGGCFTTAGSLAVNNIARWNLQSKTWSTLGSGLILSEYGGGVGVSALSTHSNMLYAGGAIEYAGGKPSSGMAIWQLTAPPPPTPTPTPAHKLNAQSSINGASGSRFVYRGENFPVNQALPVSLSRLGNPQSRHNLASTVQSDANGRVSFTLVTSPNAAIGPYKAKR